MTHIAAAERGLAAIKARSSEVVVRCPDHGEFTKGDLLKFDMWEDVCPICHRAKVEALQRDQRLKNAAHFFRTGSGVPPRFQEASFGGYNPGTEDARKIFEYMREYTEHFEHNHKLGRSLILCGKAGTGKTHLSCALLRSLAHEKGITGKYATAYRAVQEVRESYGSREISELQAIEAFIKPDLLVLDEIGAQYGTDSEHLILFNIINGRYEDLKPTIVISNLNVEGMKKYLDERGYDRLRENGGAVLVFDWGSYRQGSLRDRSTE